jgi:hypothetical protein
MKIRQLVAVALSAQSAFVCYHSRPLAVSRLHFLSRVKVIVSVSRPSLNRKQNKVFHYQLRNREYSHNLRLL